MKLTVGEKVYYPGRGPCLVGAIVQKVVCGMSASFYQLTLLNNRPYKTGATARVIDLFANR